MKKLFLKCDWSINRNLFESEGLRFDEGWRKRGDDFRRTENKKERKAKYKFYTPEIYCCNIGCLFTVKVFLNMNFNRFNLLAPEFYISILAHLYVKCE
jgi:hypothetical protein